MKKIVSICLALVLVLSLGTACSKKQEPNSKSEVHIVTPEEKKDPVVTPVTDDLTTISGKVVVITNTVLSLEATALQCTFLLTPNTLVEGATSVNEGDIVDISYEGNLVDGATATKISVLESAPKIELFEGLLLEQSENTLTVSTADDLKTHTFIYNSTTEIVGKLTHGDKVKITSYGTLESRPFAIKIEVVEEKSTPTAQKLTGFVSDVSNSAITVAVDSSHNYTFALTNATKYTGAAKKATKDDKVTITYTGGLSAQPVAAQVEIVSVHKETPRAKVSGVVTALAGNGFSVKIGSGHVYFFLSDKTTKWSGDNLDVNCNVDITYTGTIDKSPKAVEVSIQKPAPTPTPAPAPTPTPAPTPPPVPTYKSSGVVQSVAGNGFSLNTGSGVFFVSTNSYTVWGGVCAIGDQCNVEVEYTGNLGQMATAKSVNVYPPTPEPTPEPEPTPDPEPPVENPMRTVKAVVYDLDTQENTIDILINANTSIHLDTTEVTYVDGENPEVGDKIIVTYNNVSQEARSIEVVSKHIVFSPVILPEEQSSDEPILEDDGGNEPAEDAANEEQDG